MKENIYVHVYLGLKKMRSCCSERNPTSLKIQINGKIEKLKPLTPILLHF